MAYPSVDLSLSVSIHFVTLELFELLYIKACDTGMKITFVEDLRDHMPGVLLGCQLLKVPIDKLDRAKLTKGLQRS